MVFRLFWLETEGFWKLSDGKQLVQSDSVIPVFLLYCDLRDCYTTSTCESLLKFYPRPSILMWKTEFAKNELNNISDPIVSSGSLATWSWRTVWFATLGKPPMATLSKAKKCHMTSETRVRKNILLRPGSSSFSPLELCPCHKDVQVMDRENATEKPRWKVATIAESLQAHESLVDLSFQITSFLPKSWTLSSSDKTFLALSLGILTLRIYEHKKPLFCTTKFGDHLLCNHPTWNNNDVYTYFIYIYIHIIYIYTTFIYIN